MSLWEYLSIAFLLTAVLLVLRGIWGYKRRGNLDGGLDHIGYGGGDQADGH